MGSLIAVPQMHSRSAFHESEIEDALDDLREPALPLKSSPLKACASPENGSTSPASPCCLEDGSAPRCDLHEGLNFIQQVAMWSSSVEVLTKIVMADESFSRCSQPILEPMNSALAVSVMRRGRVQRCARGRFLRHRCGWHKQASIVVRVTLIVLTYAQLSLTKSCLVSMAAPRCRKGLA